MSLMFQPLRKFATFSGRARRKEYWLFQLLMLLLFGALFAWLVAALPPGFEDATEDQQIEAIANSAMASAAAVVIALASLAVLIPALAVTVRRLHDSDKSGWWLLLNFIPVGGLVLLIFYLLDGTSGPNRHGEDPKGRNLETR